MPGGRPFQPGHPRFGGRKPGTKDKLVAAREAAIFKSGQSPLDYLVSVYRDESEPTATRVDAARTVCQYVYPRLQSVDVNGRDGQPLVVQVIRFSDLAVEEYRSTAIAPPPMIEAEIVKATTSDALGVAEAVVRDEEDKPS
jgi:hypothetical protein